MPPVKRACMGSGPPKQTCRRTQEARWDHGELAGDVSHAAPRGLAGGHVQANALYVRGTSDHVVGKVDLQGVGMQTSGDT